MLFVVLTKPFERAAWAIGPLKKANLLPVPVVVLMKIKQAFGVEVRLQQVEQHVVGFLYRYLRADDAQALHHAVHVGIDGQHGLAKVEEQHHAWCGWRVSGRRAGRAAHPPSHRRLQASGRRPVPRRRAWCGARAPSTPARA
uniref:Uncharacterized protein n=1 Tax=Tanacetum cinerariifolium TaxID=118510 RepID=A0A699TWV1_TANCI|nr:hypothetical protein [Tanacetum cinerariifolium]